MKTVLIIEDHLHALERMREVITKAFGEVEISEALTLGSASRVIRQISFDLIVLDLDLPDGKGEDFIPELNEVYDELPYVVVSTIHDESDRLLAALNNGAKGYLLKEQTKNHLISEFRGILNNKPPLAPTVTNQLMDFVRNMSNEISRFPTKENDRRNFNSFNLTDREKEILVLIAKGYERQEIAGMLSISKHTVATHISKVYSKLDIKSRAEAALVASRYMLL